MDKEAFTKRVLEALENLVTLKIVTVVGTYDAKASQPGPGTKMMRTRLNLLDGDRVTEIDPEFASGALAPLRDYHAQMEKQGNDIIKANIETIEKLIGMLAKLDVKK